MPERDSTPVNDKPGPQQPKNDKVDRTMETLDELFEQMFVDDVEPGRSSDSNEAD